MRIAGVMLHSDLAQAAYLAIILVPPLIWPRLTHDAPRLPERVTAGGLLN